MKNFKRTILILFILFVFSFVIDLKSGSLNFSLLEIIKILFGRGESITNTLIIKDLRLPRVLTAILVGCSLSVSGLLLQTLFRNPLAGPYVFGISSGASFGVAFLLLGLSFIGISSLPSTFSIAFAAILGAGLVLLVMLLISIKINNSIIILILGIMLGSGISAVVNLMQFFSSAPMLKKFIIWTMGSLDGVHKTQIGYFGLATIIPVIFTILISKYLDTLYLGTENAKTLGVNTQALQTAILTITGIMTGITTAFCGPITFIGIAVPNLVRIIFKTSKHLHLIFYSIFVGATIMLLSDAISHSFASHILPINSLTALLGIPVIIWVLTNNKNFS